MSRLIQEQLTKELNTTNAISYNEISNILDAFQIASGQGFAIGKTKAILEFLKNGNSLTIENFNNTNENRKITSISELDDIYKNIDVSVNLSIDKDFIEYFT